LLCFTLYPIFDSSAMDTESYQTVNISLH